MIDEVLDVFQDVPQLVTSRFMNIMKKNPLIESLDYQKRLFQRIQEDDFPILEKLRMINLIHDNVQKLLIRKFSKVSIELNEIGRNMIEILYQEIADYLMDQFESMPEEESIIFWKMYENSHKDSKMLQGYNSNEWLYIFHQESKDNFLAYQQEDRKRQLYINQFHHILWFHVPTIIFMLKEYTEYLENKFGIEENPHLYFKPLNNRMKECITHWLDFLDKHHEIITRVPDDTYETLNFIQECCNSDRIDEIYISLSRIDIEDNYIKAIVSAILSKKKVYIFLDAAEKSDESKLRYFSDGMIGLGAKVFYGGKKCYGCDYNIDMNLFLAISVDKKIYAHFSTGDYNESLSAHRTDLHLFTCNMQKTSITLAMLKSLMYQSDDLPIPGMKDEIWFSPINLRTTFIGLLETEIAKKDKGNIYIKCNELTDPELMHDLYRAVSAGCMVRICVRSVCLMTLDENPPNLSIWSHCGRYSENEKICIFGNRIFFLSGGIGYEDFYHNIEYMVELTGDIKDNQFQKYLPAILNKEIYYSMCNRPVFTGIESYWQLVNEEFQKKLLDKEYKKDETIKKTEEMYKYIF